VQHKHKSLSRHACPIARSLDRVGEWWSMLILRDSLNGLTRFDQFQQSLDIAPNILTRRLAGLVADGLLEKRLYCLRPRRYEYVPTERGRDFKPVLIALLAWGNKHLAPEGASVVVEDVETGAVADPVVVDRRSGRLLEGPGFRLAAGPAANARVRAKYARNPTQEDQP
jgi:DNA-binding HxlR family transcriptional regulator